jgi:hypothetical protein
MGGSLFPTDNSGVIGILVSLVALVLFGVMLTLLIDGHISVGGSGGNSESALAGASASAEATIVGLEAERKYLEAAVKRQHGRDGLRKQCEERRGELAALEDQIVRLGPVAAEERARIGRLREAFAGYRMNYRKRLWGKAVGRELGEVRTNGGKVYREVTIRNVSALGMRISHRTGSATLEVVDLSDEFLEAYQLSHAEARGILATRREAQRARLEEREQEREAVRQQELADARERASEAKSRIPSRRVPPRTVRDPEKEAEIAELRLEVAGLRARVATLRAQVAEARRKAYGNQRSPPGSLETWEQRAVRLAGVAGKLNAKLEVVVGRLRALDPTYSPYNR